MSHPAPQPDMAWHLRRLLEAVKDACGLEGRWRWLTGPMALVAWVWTRRERQEAVVAMTAFQGMVETLLGIVEDFRAGRLRPECAVANEEDGTGAAPSPRVVRCAGQCPVKGETKGAHEAVAAPPPLPSPARAGLGREADRRACGVDGAVAYPSPSRSPGSSPGAGPAHRIKSGGKPALKGRGILRGTAREFSAVEQWIPAFAGMTGTVGGAGILLSLRARSPPGQFFKTRAGPRGFGAALLLRYSNDEPGVQPWAILL